MNKHVKRNENNIKKNQFLINLMLKIKGKKMVLLIA